MSTRNRFAALVPVSTLVCLDRFTTISSRILTNSQCVNSMIISIRLDHGERLVASILLTHIYLFLYLLYSSNKIIFTHFCIYEDRLSRK